MLKAHLHLSQSPNSLFPLAKKPSSFHRGDGNSPNAFLPLHSRPSLKRSPKVRVGFVPSNIKASVVDSASRRIITVKAVVTAIPTVSSLISSISIDSGLDKLQDALGKSLLLELVSAELDLKTGSEKPTIKAFAHKATEVKGETTYEAKFSIPSDFGAVGAMFVENEHHKEMFLKDIVLDGFDTGRVKIICGSWVQPKSDKTQKKRVFFTAKEIVRGKK